MFVIVSKLVDVLIPVAGSKTLWNRDSLSVNTSKLVVPITPPPVDVTIPVNWELMSSINKTLFVIDSL